MMTEQDVALMLDEALKHYRLATERSVISKRDAARIARVFIAIQRQIDWAFRDARNGDASRWNDATSMSMIFGRCFYRALGSCTEEL
jgi:SRSO17 transposase